MFKIDYNDGNVSLNCILDRKLMLLEGNSGSGKTYLMDLLKSYFVINKVPFRAFSMDAFGADESAIISMCRGAQVVLFDNADLYLTSGIVKSILNDVDLVIICAHTFDMDDYVESMGYYTVNYSPDGIISIERETL